MIQGKRVFLRGLERGDLKLLHKMMNDEEVMEWARFRPDHTISMEALEKQYEEELKGESATRRTFAIVDKNSGRVIGWSSIRWFRPFHTTADVGLAIAVQHAGSVKPSFEDSPSRHLLGGLESSTRSPSPLQLAGRGGRTSAIP